MGNKLVAHPIFSFIFSIYWGGYISGDVVFPEERWEFYESEESWLRHWLKTPILNRRHAEVQKITEREKYPTFLRLQLPMILTKTIKGFHYKIQTPTINVGKKIKIEYESVSPVSW